MVFFPSGIVLEPDKASRFFASVFPVTSKPDPSIFCSGILCASFAGGFSGSLTVNPMCLTTSRMPLTVSPGLLTASPESLTTGSGCITANQRSLTVTPGSLTANSGCLTGGSGSLTVNSGRLTASSGPLTASQVLATFRVMGYFSTVCRGDG